MKTSVCIGFLVAVCLSVSTGPAAYCMSSQEDEETPGGLAAGGKVVPLVPDADSTCKAMLERVRVLKSAREVRELLFSNDTLWIATDGGLFCYSTFQDTVVEVNGDFAPSVWAVSMDEYGRLFVGDDSGLSVRKGGRWVRYSKRANPFLSRIRDIVCSDGSVWLATFGNGCGVINGDSLRIYTMQDSLLDDRVNRVLVENRHSVFFGTESGMCHADTSKWDSYRYGRRIPLGAVKEIAFDEGGNLFLAVSGHGVVLYNLMRVRQFGTEDGLPSLEIKAFSLDPDGNLWAGGVGGVSYYDGSGWVPFMPDGYGFGGSRVLSLEHDVEGNLYAGTDDGRIIVVSMGAVRELRVPQKFPGDRVSRIRHAGSGNFFVVDGLCYRSEGFDLIPIELPADWFDGAVMDVLPMRGGGELWVATRFGLLHLINGSWQLFDRRQGLPTDFFTSVALDSSGNVWFSTFDSALLELARDRWIHHTEDSGLAGSVVTDMVVDSGGEVWVVVSGKELLRYSDGWRSMAVGGNEGGSGFSESNVDTSIANIPGVRMLESAFEPADGNRLALGVDVDGNLLIASGSGIYRLFDGEWQSVNLPEGLSGISPTDVFVGSNGEVFLGTSDRGLIVYSGGRWIPLDSSVIAGDDHVLCISHDSRGNVLVGTQTCGLIVISEGTVDGAPR